MTTRIIYSRLRKALSHFTKENLALYPDNSITILRQIAFHITVSGDWKNRYYPRVSLCHRISYLFKSLLVHLKFISFASPLNRCTVHAALSIARTMHHFQLVCLPCEVAGVGVTFLLSRAQQAVFPFSCCIFVQHDTTVMWPPSVPERIPEFWKIF